MKQIVTPPVETILTVLITMLDSNLALYSANRHALPGIREVSSIYEEKTITPEHIEDAYDIPVGIRLRGGRQLVVQHSGAEVSMNRQGIFGITVMGM